MSHGYFTVIQLVHGIAMGSYGANHQVKPWLQVPLSNTVAFSFVYKADHIMVYAKPMCTGHTNVIAVNVLSSLVRAIGIRVRWHGIYFFGYKWPACGYVTSDNQLYSGSPFSTTVVPNLLMQQVCYWKQRMAGHPGLCRAEPHWSMFASRRLYLWEHIVNFADHYTGCPLL